MPSPTTLNPFRVVLRHRNFRLFLIGQTLSLIGTWMQTMAQGWLALELTNSAFLVGLVATVSAVPILLFTMPAGAIVDRSDKLRIVRIAQVAFLGGVIASIEIPARQAMMIDLVGREDLPDAIALNSSGFNLARVVGPGLAAAVIARLGIAWCFFLNAASFLAVLAGLFMMQLPPWVPVRHRTSPWQGVVQVIRYMRDTPDIRALMLMVTFYSIFNAPVLALMPVVAREMFSLGAGGYGLLLSFLGIGGLCGALGLAAVGDRISRTRLLTVVSMLWPALLMTFSLTRVPWIGYGLLFAIGVVMILNGAIANGLLQGLVPDALRGRIMAAYGLVVVGLAQVVGAFTGGVVAHAVGVAGAIFTTALLMAAYGVWAFLRRPELRELRARTV